MTSFTIRSGRASGREKSSSDAISAMGALAELVAVSDAPGMMASQVARFGDAEKPADMGVTVASRIVSGLTPTISSMVRSMETVEWKVESTVAGCE